MTYYVIKFLSAVGGATIAAAKGLGYLLGAATLLALWYFLTVALFVCF